MTYSEIIEQVADELNLPVEVVDIAYKSFYDFIRAKIIELPLKEELTEEQFSNLRTCFNLPSLGKLHCTYDRYLGMKEQFKYLNRIKNNEA